MGLCPLVVARSQLLTAIDIFFNDRDPVSVHVLASNAREMLESLCRLAAVEPIAELFLRDYPNKPKKDVYAVQFRGLAPFATLLTQRCMLYEAREPLQESHLPAFCHSRPY